MPVVFPWNLTTAPGSIVNVTPLATEAPVVTTYGLAAFVHVLFELIDPFPFVARADSASPRPKATTTADVTTASRADQ
jgi:hypothetical protein